MSGYERVHSFDRDMEPLLHKKETAFQTRKLREKVVCYSACFLLLISTNIVAFVAGKNWKWSELEHLKMLTTWSPIHSSNVFSLHYDMLNATTQTDNPSLWRADPSPEGDKLWQDSWDSRPMLLPISDMEKLGQDKSYIARFPDSDMAMVGSHAHHLLHCLDVLRKTIWTDHYWPRGNLNPTHRTHQTHCLDILREDLMCRAPMDVYPFIWMEGQLRPQPNFNISMQCSDWNAMSTWWSERQMSSEQVRMKMVKPVGVKEWPSPEALLKEDAVIEELCSRPDYNCTIDGRPI